jgi:CRP-like cAMP-binding protein
VPNPNTDISDQDLRHIYLFAGFDDGQLQAVRRSMRVQQLDEGERLFDHGQPARHYFYLRRGQVKLFRVSPDGDEKVIEIIGPDQTFAEAVMFMERRGGYPVSAEAIEPTEVWAFDQQTMLGLLHGSVDTCLRLLANMSMRLRRHVNEVDKLTLHNATFRLVSYLLQQMPADVVESPEVQLTTPKNVIASRLSIQPETFSRILGRLSKAGLVEVHGHSIVLRDIAGLRKQIEI